MRYILLPVLCSLDHSSWLSALAAIAHFIFFNDLSIERSSIDYHRSKDSSCKSLQQSTQEQLSILARENRKTFNYRYSPMEGDLSIIEQCTRKGSKTCIKFPKFGAIGMIMHAQDTSTSRIGHSSHRDEQPILAMEFLAPPPPLVIQQDLLTTLMQQVQTKVMMVQNL